MNTSTIVYDDEGNRLELEVFNKGGEGYICYIAGNSKECAKIYKKQPTDELFKKIAAMIDNLPSNNLLKQTQNINGPHIPLAWPTSILYGDPQKSKFVGFKMPMVNRKLFYQCHKYYDIGDRIKGFGGKFTWKHLLLTALNLVITIDAVHEKGHCIGDLRETNVLVASNGLVTIIDCDSFEIKDGKTGETLFCRVGFGEYLPPELISVNFGNKNYHRYYSDLFALGILIFKLLMNGTHPYQAKGPLVSDAPTPEDKIKKGYYPYDNKYPDVKPPDHALPYDIIPPSIQQLFTSCFVDGHGDPKKRPTTDEWYKVLKTEYDNIKICTVNQYHMFAENLSYCPWCRLKIDGKDIFPLSEPARVSSTIKTSPITVSGDNIIHPTAQVFFSTTQVSSTTQEYYYKIAAKLLITALVMVGIIIFLRILRLI